MKRIPMGLIIWLATFSLAWAVDEEASSPFTRAGENAASLKAFIEAASENHGEFGHRAATFLVKSMPEQDLRTLDEPFLTENLDLAMKARETFPWAKEIPEAVFFNDVLPYAALDETRENWRREFFPVCADLVKDCQTATEAAQALNKDFFNILQVHYNTGRKAPNQSPFESKKLGKATCTGLSIILVDACRAVGVPARVTGTALWANKRGNHTWTEIYDNGEWYFTGADEYDAAGLNRGWFVGSAAQAKADDWRHAIWASSWQPTGFHFPMVWNLEDKTRPAVNVTGRYAKETEAKPETATLFLRVWDQEGGQRLAVPVEVRDPSGKILQTLTTKNGTADLNDMPSVDLPVGQEYRLRVTHEGESRWDKGTAAEAGPRTLDLAWDTLTKGRLPISQIEDWLKLLPEERTLSVPQGTLSREEAEKALALTWQTLQSEERQERTEALKDKVITVHDHSLKFLEKTFGDAEEGRRSLWISMHGGGGAPSKVNDQQWNNQIRLYAPEEGIVVAPRAPTDSWNMWHQSHVDALFARLIETYVIAGGVDPNRVYLMGYSAGGDGVYQLAPRMADRFAAAAMMAGHPNDANPLGLRNLPFMIFMGGDDEAYSRNRIAAEWGQRLADLRQGDADGYLHQVTIYEGLGHWMEGKDQEALPWMAQHTRDPWPKKVVWNAVHPQHQRFYWLAAGPDSTLNHKGGPLIAQVQGQVIAIETGDTEPESLQLRLHDTLLNLDEPVIVTVNGQEKFRGPVDRTMKAIWTTLQERRDPAAAATALLTLRL